MKRLLLSRSMLLLTFPKQKAYHTQCVVYLTK